MNKLLITEINRIQELMGKPLITEITIPKKLIEELIGKFGPKMSKTVNDLITSLKNATDNDVIANIIAKLANEDESLAKLITPKVIANLPIESRNNIEAVKDYFDELLRKNVPVSDEQKRKTIDTFMKNNVKTELKGVNDIIRKEITDYVDELFPSKPAKKVTDLTDEIPESSISTTPSGKKRLDIFDTETWTDSAIKVDNEIIAKLANNKMWDKVKREFESLFTITRPRIEYIQKLAKAINTTTNTEYKSKLKPMLKKELEWVYGKQQNTFVSLRDYFDDVAIIDRDWGRVWRDIKTKSDNGWNFYKVFGALDSMPWFTRVRKGLLNDIGVNFETEKSVFSFISNKLSRGTIPRMAKEDFKGNFMNFFKSGSRSGFPKMTNKAYEDVIGKYGLTGAKTRYFRDLIIGSLKWNFYIGFLVTVRNSAANFYFEDAVTDCVNSGNLNSESCKKINDSEFNKKIANWSLQYRKNPNEQGNLYGKWLKDEFLDFTLNLPNISKENDSWTNVAEILTLDPGLIGELIKFLDDIRLINDDPAVKRSLMNYLNSELERARIESERANQRLNDQVERVQDRTENIVDGITNTEQGFKNWCEANNKTCESYNKDNNGLGEDTDGSFWRFKDGTFERFFTNDEKGFKDWCEAKQKPFKSYNGGLGKTTDGQVWEFKNGTFQLFI